MIIIIIIIMKSGFLIEKKSILDVENSTYELSPLTIQYLGEKDGEDYFIRDLILFTRDCSELPWPLTRTIQGKDLPPMPVWPPKTKEDCRHLEKWMTSTIEGPIGTILDSNAFESVLSFFDCGCGDGSIGIALCNEFDQMTGTLYNLPVSIEIAKENIRRESGSIQSRLNVVAGNFLLEDFPQNNTGYDVVLFSRLLTDWSPEVCLSLFEKAKKILKKSGKIVINEALYDGNEDMCIAWEYRYIFYDTFGKHTYKTLKDYEVLLREAGFTIKKVTPMTDYAFYSVIEAYRND